jgi:hypothetical protein
MPITRIKNNQVTDASAGNLYLGINAAVKLQDYSITAGKISNSLVYGSDLTVTGNLTVNGQTTTIDTVSVVIEDPILYLAANQTGAPSLDIGFIGERGTSQNIAFVWDESLGEFVTVYTNDTTTNTTVTIASYASFRTLDAAVTGNLTVTGTAGITGNISLGNVSATGLINATGNITGGNLVSNAMVSAATTVNATGNITGGNLVSNAAVSAATTISATGNITGGNLISNAAVVATGLISSGTTISATGNITGGNLISNAAISAATTIDATGNITGGNLTTVGTANIGTLEVTGTTSLTGNIISALNVTGNLAGGNISTPGNITAVGNVQAGNLISSGAVIGNVQITGNLVLGNLSVTGVINTTGNITGGNLVSNAAISATTTVNATGNITGGNLVSNAAVSATTTVDATGNITGGNLVSNAAVVASGLISSGTTISATGNITGGNLISNALISGATLTTTGNALIGGNLIVQGNLTYINIDDLRVEDPVIIMGTGPNGAPLTTDDGMDRGIYMEYYKSGLGNASVFWDNSTGNLVAATSVNFSGNNIINVLQYGTFQTGNLYATGNITATANISGNFVAPGSNTQVMYNNNGLIAGDSGMTYDATTDALTVTGTTSVGNLSTIGTVSATGNVTGGNLVSNANISAATAIFATGNITGGNLVSNASISAATTVSATGNITGGNLVSNSAVTTVTLTATGNANVGNLGTAGLIVATGNITGGNLSAGAGTITTTGNVNAGNVNVTNGVYSSTGYFTGNVDILGTLTATSNVIANTSGIFYGNAVTGNAAIFGGVPGFTTLGSNVVIQFAGNANSYSQVNFENINGGNAASTDYVATANNGDDGTFFINMGITSNTHVGIHDQFFTEHATNNTGYVYVVASDETGPGSSGIGNLLLGSTNGNVITWVGNTGAANVRTIASTDGFDVTNGNLYVTNITSRDGRITVNNGDGDIDFAVDGDTTANVLYVDAGAGTISFGSSTQTVNAGVAMNYTNSFLAPVGNSAQRPAVGVAGMVRYNSTTSSLEFYDSTQWQSTGTTFTVVQSQTFNGDGSQVAFTINAGYTTASCIVSINGILQVPVTAYAVAGTTLTFTEAPAVGDLIEVREIVTTTSVKGITNANGSAVIEVTDTTNYIQTTGNILPAGNLLYDLGSPTNQWNELYLSGNSIYMGGVILKASGGNLKVRNFDDTADAGVEGTFYATSTTSGNLQIGLNHIEATNVNGNIELRPNGTGVAYVSTRLQIANIQVVDAGANTVVFYRADGTTPATISNQNIDSTQIASGTSSMAVISSGGNIRANVGGATIATFWSGGINNGQANGVGNIGTSTSYFNTAFVKATSAQYADLAEMYEADAAYEPGTVLCFGGAKEVTVCDIEDCTRVAGVVSTNPSYLMNSGQTGAHVAAVALQGRVPTKVTGQIRKGDLIVSAGDGRGCANNEARAGTIIGKALADFDGQDGVIEVVVGRV